MIKYKLNKYSIKIVKVEILRETKKSVIVTSKDFEGVECETRESNELYFNTWKEAHAVLFEREEQKLVRARLNLQQSQAAYDVVKGMKEQIK